MIYIVCDVLKLREEAMGRARDPSTMPLLAGVELVEKEVEKLLRGGAHTAVLSGEGRGLSTLW